MDSEFMQFFAEALSEKKLRVVRFEFPYMAGRRQPDGKKKPPDREPKLRESWLEAIASQGKRKLFIGGKSMGGRIASLIADQAKPLGLICLGYPFHPVGKPDKLRIEHLQAISTPTLILQGQRDPFGKQEEVGGYDLSSNIELQWLPDGDHSFKPRKNSGRTQEQNWEEAAEAIVRFIERQLAD